MWRAGGSGSPSQAETSRRWFGVPGSPSGDVGPSGRTLFRKTGVGGSCRRTWFQSNVDNAVRPCQATSSASWPHPSRAAPCPRFSVWVGRRSFAQEPSFGTARCCGRSLGDDSRASAHSARQHPRFEVVLQRVNRWQSKTALLISETMRVSSLSDSVGLANLVKWLSFSLGHALVLHQPVDMSPVVVKYPFCSGEGTMANTVPSQHPGRKVVVIATEIFMDLCSSRFRLFLPTHSPPKYERYACRGIRLHPLLQTHFWHQKKRPVFSDNGVVLCSSSLYTRLQVFPCARKSRVSQVLRLFWVKFVCPSWGSLPCEIGTVLSFSMQLLFLSVACVLFTKFLHCVWRCTGRSFVRGVGSVKHESPHQQHVAEWRICQVLFTEAFTSFCLVCDGTISLFPHVAEDCIVRLPRALCYPRGCLFDVFPSFWADIAVSVVLPPRHFDTFAYVLTTREEFPFERCGCLSSFFRFFFRTLWWLLAVSLTIFDHLIGLMSPFLCCTVLHSRFTTRIGCERFSRTSRKRHVVWRRTQEHGSQANSTNDRRAFSRPFLCVVLCLPMETILNSSWRLVLERLFGRMETHGWWVLKRRRAVHGEFCCDGNMMPNAKISQPYNNDLKKHFWRRDRHDRQIESMVRILGKFLEPRVRHLFGRELRHHYLLFDLGAILFTRSNSVFTLIAWGGFWQVRFYPLWHFGVFWAPYFHPIFRPFLGPPSPLTFYNVKQYSPCFCENVGFRVKGLGSRFWHCGSQ